MGFLSKIYERRGKAQRQAGFGGFKNGAEDVSGKGTGATSGGSLADPPGSSPAARDFQARDASGPASAVPGDPQPKPRSTSRSRARSKPDPFDFETSRDAAVEEPPVSPSTRSPPSRSKPKPASRGGSPSPSGAARNKPSSSRSPGTASASPLGSPGTFGAARDAVPSPRDAPGTGAGRGSAEAAADLFLPTPGKRRRVTFAEVDAFTLDEEEDEDDVDVPAHGRRDRDPFDFPEDGDEDVALAPPAATITASRSPRPAWGVFGGSPATSPEARPKHGSKSTAVDSGLTAPSPEWAKRAPVPSRSRSASPMDADAPRSVEKKRNAPKQKPLLPPHFPHSPSAAMAMASPSPPPRIGGGPGTRDALPESSDALAALDEAQYALSGLGADQPEAGRLACASSLVSIVANARLRRALAQHGLAPRLCRAALDLCASVLGVHARDDAAADGGGVIARALAAERRRATSPALGVSAAALLYLSTLELRAGEAAAVYAGRDVAGILAELMRRADFSAEEDESAESRGDSKGARRRLLGETHEDADAVDETKNGNASSFGFGALLANGAEAKALRTTRDALRNLKFLPHESVDAPTLALLATHRALAQTERAAARASQREARRRVEAEKRAEERAADGHPADPRADHDSSPSEEREARRAEAEGDEAAVLGWSGFKESLAARGAVLETARLADEAAREICQAGARCFSRRETHETHIGEDENGDGGVEDDSTRAGRATARLFRCMRVVEAATFGSPSCADACVSGSLAPAPELYAKPPREPLRLVPMRVNDAIASPAPKSPKPSTVGGAGTMRDTRAKADVVREAGDERALADVVRDTRVDGIELSPRASPDREAALKSRGADGDGGGSTGAKRRATEEEDAAATAKRFRTAEALLLTPSPGSKRFGGESRAGAVAGAIDAAGASFLVDEVTRDASRNGDARNGDASRTRTRRRGDAETRRGNVSAPREPGEPPAAAAETPTFNFSRVAAAVDASIAWLDDDKADVHSPSKAPACGDARPWTMVHALLGAIPTLAAAAATAAHATDAGDFVCGVRTARAGGLGADPRLAAGTLRAVVCVLTNLTNENPAGCAAVRAAGGLETAAALIPWCAALEGLLPGAGPDAAARAAAAARGGVLEPKRATASRRAPTNADVQTQTANAEGHDMLNAALCFLVNVAETDADARRVLRALEADAGAMESFARRRDASPSAAATLEPPPLEPLEPLEAGRRFDVPPPKRAATRASAAKKKKAAETKVALASRHVGLVELLARLFVRAGGAGPTEDGFTENETEAAARRSETTRDFRDAFTKKKKGGSRPFALASGEVTAEMLETETRARKDASVGQRRDPTEGDGLITQAYAALLVAFLVEGQPALRADVRSALPEDGFAALAGVLERFRAFHEQIESISEESRASLTRVIRWLRGT